MKKIVSLKMLLFVISLSAASILLSSCYPDYGLTAADYDIVATFKADSANFQNYRTFFMPDSVIRITDGPGGSSINTQFDDLILEEVANQFLANGYQRVGNENNADVAIFVGATSSDNLVYYPGYWWGYWGWYYPWYGGGYAYSYKTGSLFVTMIDRDLFDPANKVIGAIWAGTANGLLDDSKQNVKSRIVLNIDKMFNQSPYLKIIE